MADAANSTFLLTRRNALIGGLTSLFIPAAAVPLAQAIEVSDPWEEVSVHAYALRDALNKVHATDPFWRVVVTGGDRPEQSIAAYNAIGARMRFVSHPSNFERG